TAWDATTVYKKNDVVTFLGVGFMSRINFNSNQPPSLTTASTSAPDWASATTYSLNDLVTGSDGVLYQSLANGNTGNNPISDFGVHWQNQGVLTPWTTTFVAGTGSIKWRQIGGPEFPVGVNITPFNFVYPINSGPSTQEATKNVFRLPATFLRVASQEPKAGSQSLLGAHTNRTAVHWLFHEP